MRIHAAEKFQGNPCKFGHPGLRYRSSGACVECMRLKGIAKRHQKRAQIEPCGPDCVLCREA